MNVIVDSDVVIHVTRGREVEVLRQWTELCRSGHSILCSPVTVAEVWGGARKSEFPAIEAAFSAIECLPITEETGRRAGDYIRRFGKSHGVEVPDALIAAAAPFAGAALWTHNRKHYPMQDVDFY
jgi:predicted nucleic acid-binding protein